jgi:hypothetical protein
MKTNLLRVLVPATLPLLLCGCISHEETVYQDVERVPVRFENDTAARLFYETLNDSKRVRSGTESKTSVTLPLIFETKRRVVTGHNAAFNDAVARCDTNKDGLITEMEAKIFSEIRNKS